MTLTLRAVTLNDTPLSQPLIACFDAQGGTIGRADQNTLALPDPERHISRRQAEIAVQDGRYLIRNVGAANPIFVGGRPLLQGESSTLADQDQVRIGGYLLMASQAEPEADAGATQITRGRMAAPRPDADVRGAASPLAEPLHAVPSSRPGQAPLAPPSGAGARLDAPASPANPFADLLAPSPAGGAGAAPVDPFADLLPPAAGVPAASAAWSAPSVPAAARLPDDFDPFAPAEPATPAPPASAPERGAGAFDDLLPTPPAASSLDAMFGLGGPAAGHDPLAQFMATPLATPPAAGGPAVSVAAAPSLDPLAMFGAEAPAPATPAPALPASDHAPAWQEPMRMPRPMPGRAAAPATPPPSVGRADAGATMPPAAQAAPAAPGAEADLLWQAFREGAGLGPTFTGRLTPEFMRVVGRMLREFVHGTRQLVQVRAATKTELRAAVTMIQSTQNNPLKFSPDTQSALEQMLSPPLRGFLDGPQAVTDAMDDLAGHLIGTLAGMRAALDGMLDRFEPKAVEGKLVETRLLDSVLPHARKARLWELYLQHYAGLREQAQEDFHTVFGKAFLAAYEQQVERLEAERQARPASR